MSIEISKDVDVLEHQPNINPEEIWGGHESEWARWETASPEERDFDLGKYMEEQKKVMLSKETRDAYAVDFAAKFGDMPMPEPTELDLVNFYMAHGGSIYFKRRFYWRRNDQDLSNIKNYYQNKIWEKETVDHAIET